MCVRFPLSLRNVEDLLDECGFKISHETMRFCWNMFGPLFAVEIRQQRFRACDQAAGAAVWKRSSCRSTAASTIFGGPCSCGSACLFSSFLESSRLQIVASVPVRFPGGKYELPSPASDFEMLL